MTASRIVLVVSGAAAIAVGAVFFVQDLTLGEIAGVVLWLAAAVVLHDAILVPGFALAGRRLRRVAQPVPISVLVVVEAGFAVGVVLTAVVIPEIVAQLLGPRNPTVVPGDYLLRLGMAWVGIAAVVVTIAGIIVWRRRSTVRRKTRSSSASRAG